MAKGGSSLLNDLSKLQISDQIKNEAESIYQSLHKDTKRKTNRKRQIFYCLYRAYHDSGEVKEPTEIAKIVGLKSSEINAAFALFSQIQTGYPNPIVQRTPQDFVPGILQSVGVDLEDRSALMELFDEILQKDPSLLEEFPQAVAGAIIFYYLEINGVPISKKDVAKSVNRSEMTLQKVYKKIVAVHNA